jgi:tetratricopeptide (TPR) repeat protein
LRRELLARAVASPLPQETTPILEALLTVPLDELDGAPILELAEKAAANIPENLHLVGEALYRNNQFAAAVETYARAARVSPSRPTSKQARDHFFVAMAQQRLENADQGRENLQLGVEGLSASIAAKPDDPETVLSGWCERIALRHLRQEAEEVVQK